MGFKMKGPSMNISYGGESNKQQKSDLLKDNPVAKHASAMNMSDAQDNNLSEALQDELPQEGRTSPTSKKGTMAYMLDKGSALLEDTRNSGDKDTRTAEEKEAARKKNRISKARHKRIHGNKPGFKN